jgi:ABC-type histidine transport system ATPase subunit
VSVENGHASKCVCVLEVNKDCKVHVSSFTKVVTQLRNSDVKTAEKKQLKYISLLLGLLFSSGVLRADFSTFSNNKHFHGAESFLRS